MAALDFPASPTLNQQYPSPAVTGVPVYTWDGEKWTTKGGAIGSTGGADDPPPMDGAGNAGVSTQWAREDHIHPTDTTRTSATDVNNIVKAYAAPYDAMSYSGMQVNGGFEVAQYIYDAPSANAIDGWTMPKNGTMLVGPAQNTAPGNIPGVTIWLDVVVNTAQASLTAPDYVFLQQKIEGWRTARLDWGYSTATPITLAFWTMHNRTGLYSGSIRNGASTRSYAFTYTQNVSDVPEYKTITIPGDTTGTATTWKRDNTAGIALSFAMACGTTQTAPSANTWLAGNYVAAPGQVNAVASTSDRFRIANVVVLPSSQAPTAAQSPNIMRPFNEEFLLCKRYWERCTFPSVYLSSSNAFIYIYMPAYFITKRAIPTGLTITTLMCWTTGGGNVAPTSLTFGTITLNTAVVSVNVASGMAGIQSFDYSMNARL